MSDAPNFRKPALVFALIYLGARSVFALVPAIAAWEGCECLAGMALIVAWPALAISLCGLLVTAVRARMKTTGDDCPVLPTMFFLLPIGLVGWTTVTASSGVVTGASTFSIWTAKGALAAAMVFSLAMIVSLRRERRAKGPPSARLVS